jgi:NADPH:quinone reductase-like Zn-dependent oxidoreductase
LLSEWLLPRSAEGALVPVIDQVYSVTQVVAAHERMEANANAGKIILTMDW